MVKDQLYHYIIVGIFWGCTVLWAASRLISIRGISRVYVYYTADGAATISIRETQLCWQWSTIADRMKDVTVVEPSNWLDRSAFAVFFVGRPNSAVILHCSAAYTLSVSET
jgi:hypothetical protein